MIAISQELTERLYSASCEILLDFDTYGEVLQTDDDGDYGPESSLGALRKILSEINIEYEKQLSAQTGGKWVFMDKLLDTKELSEILGIGKGTLQLWRKEGRIPPPVMDGEKMQSRARWSANTIEKWMADGCPKQA